MTRQLTLTAAERRQILDQRADEERANRQRQTCKGWNFHVYSLGSRNCSMCGQVKP